MTVWARLHVEEWDFTTDGDDLRMFLLSGCTSVVVQQVSLSYLWWLQLCRHGDRKPSASCRSTTENRKQSCGGVLSLARSFSRCRCLSPSAGAHDSESSSQAAEGEKCQNSSVLFQHVDRAGERPARSPDSAHPSSNTRYQMQVHRWFWFCYCSEALMTRSVIAVCLSSRYHLLSER